MRIDIDHLTLPEPEAVLLLKDEVRRLRAAIAALADQDATLSMQGGTVIVTMDATLTVEEREAICRELSWLQWCVDNNQIGDVGRTDIATLRGLLERMGGGA